MRWRRSASGHSFRVMAHIWLFGMSRTFPFQFPSRCLRMWGYSPRGEPFIKLYWLIKSQSWAEASRDSLSLSCMNVQGFSLRRAPQDPPSIKQTVDFFAPCTSDVRAQEAQTEMRDWCTSVNGRPGRQMGGRLTGFHWIQMKLTPFKFRPSYVVPSSRLLKLNSKAENTCWPGSRAAADCKHMA